MTSYQPTIPTGLVNLDVDYKNIQNNFQQLDTTYGVDHIKYSQPTNNGFHNQVTMAQITTNTDAVTTSTTNAIYALVKGAAPLLQFSRGISNSIPTPLTNIYSSSAAVVLANNATTNLMDFAGLSIAIANVYAWDSVVGLATTNITTVFWNGVSFTLTTQPAIGIIVTSTGTVLKIKNTAGVALNNVYWVLDLVRMQ